MLWLYCTNLLFPTNFSLEFLKDLDKPKHVEHCEKSTNYQYDVTESIWATCLSFFRHALVVQYSDVLPG